MKTPNAPGAPRGAGSGQYGKGVSKAKAARKGIGSGPSGYRPGGYAPKPIETNKTKYKIYPVTVTRISPQEAAKRRAAEKMLKEKQNKPSPISSNKSPSALKQMFAKQNRTKREDKQFRLEAQADDARKKRAILEAAKTKRNAKKKG